MRKEGGEGKISPAMGHFVIVTLPSNMTHSHMIIFLTAHFDGGGIAPYYKLLVHCLDC